MPPMCIEPHPPSVAFLTRPEKPFCIRAGTSCSSFEIDSYRRSVREYFQELQTYADQVAAYYRAAGEYVECMSHLD